MTAPTALSMPYDITDEHVERFATDGFIHLPEVLPADTVAGYEPQITAKVFELNTMHLPAEERTTLQRAFMQVMNLWRHSDRVRELVHSPRLAGLAAELMGVSGVRLYHDQALYKQPGGGITPGTPTSTTGPSTPTGPARSGCPCSRPPCRWGR